MKAQQQEKHFCEWKFEIDMQSALCPKLVHVERIYYCYDGLWLFYYLSITIINNFSNYKKKKRQGCLTESYIGYRYR